MRRFSIVIIVAFIALMSVAQEVRPTKNLIVMIPDGTSISVLSAARWLKVYRNEGTKLHVDPYISGTVTTFSSNAPIGDSAPTTSTFMTGIPQQAANVSIYPEADPKNDLVKIDPDSAYQPLVTILEAMQMEQNKAAGLVVTCEFPHATPADCAAHYYARSNYAAIAPQMAFNNLSVMFGGGNEFVSDAMKQHFKNTGTAYIQNDKNAMLNYSGEKVWALFKDQAMSYDLDRNPDEEPSLAEMTEKALEVLNKNKNGFFLMVEGSKVDWSAHANDPAGIIGEFLAFDEAVGKAIEFAKKDGNTTVVILPDHGNSGFSIGRRGLKKSYARLTLEDLFEGISKIKLTSVGLEKILLETKPENFKSVFYQHTGIQLNDDELKSLLSSKNYKSGDYPKTSESKNMGHYIAEIYNSKTGFGYTTDGHTGEEVFLAVYHPQGDILKGNVRNTELHNYLYKVSGLKTSMYEHTGNTFAKHTDVFRGMNYQIVNTIGKTPKLVVKFKKHTLEIPAFSSVATINGKLLDLGSVAVFIDKNNTFYLPKNLKERVFGQ
ncbi:MAG: alkaline phosphatase [Porphyromonadaceae bacterium]|jgi:alkaline phosphatase|nr:alkaline phosphatase [Porphyromonadaceae bacterium]